MPLEIRDPHIDSEQILAQVATRAAAHPSSLDPTHMGPPSLHTGSGNMDENDRFPDLQEALIDLMMSHRLLEPDFESQAPLVGGVIVAFRRAWNWMATKWYVRPILQQQSRLNSKMALLLVQIAEWQAQKEEQISTLQGQVAQLMAALEASRPTDKDRGEG